MLIQIWTKDCGTKLRRFEMDYKLLTTVIFTVVYAMKKK